MTFDAVKLAANSAPGISCPLNKPRLRAKSGTRREDAVCSEDTIVHGGAALCVHSVTRNRLYFTPSVVGRSWPVLTGFGSRRRTHSRHEQGGAQRKQEERRTREACSSSWSILFAAVAHLSAFTFTIRLPALMAASSKPSRTMAVTTQINPDDGSLISHRVPKSARVANRQLSPSMQPGSEQSDISSTGSSCLIVSVYRPCPVIS